MGNSTCLGTNVVVCAGGWSGDRGSSSGNLCQRDDFPGAKTRMVLLLDLSVPNSNTKGLESFGKKLSKWKLVLPSDGEVKELFRLAKTLGFDEQAVALENTDKLLDRLHRQRMEIGQDMVGSEVPAPVGLEPQPQPHGGIEDVGFEAMSPIRAAQTEPESSDVAPLDLAVADRVVPEGAQREPDTARFELAPASDKSAAVEDVWARWLASTRENTSGKGRDDTWWTRLREDTTTEVTLPTILLF